ncbi:hypothetical protein G6F35_017313 [Rhizopus arrhizus]|nr:hypothetical protein G6F35_017313 [Rhizopus arrhizus]
MHQRGVPVKPGDLSPPPLSSWRSTIGPWPIEQVRQSLIDKVQATASSGRLHRLDILKYPEHPAKTAKNRAAVARFRAGVTRPRAGVARYRAAVTRFTLSVASISIPISINPATSSFSRRR